MRQINDREILTKYRVNSKGLQKGPVHLVGLDRTYVSLIREFELPSPLAHAHISFTLASAAELAALRQSSLKSV